MRRALRERNLGSSGASRRCVVYHCAVGNPPDSFSRVRLEPYLPTHVGFEALAELDRVEWSSLSHAYGRGVVGGDLFGDVARSLALIREDTRRALVDGLWSNVCHQGTVYEASAYALPFIAATAAGDVPVESRSLLVALLGDIAVGGSHVAPGGSYAGSFGEGVDLLIRDTVRRCEGYLVHIEQAEPAKASLIAAIRLVTAEPSDDHRQAVLDLIDPED